MTSGLFLAGLRFEDPWLLSLLGPVLLGLALNVARELRRPAGLLFSSLGLLPAGAPGWRVQLRFILLPLRLAAAVLLVLALARPQLAQAAPDSAAEGIDIVLVLDTSSSMTSRFGASTRIDASKEVIREFLEGRRNDRVGIVVFSSEALVLAPLTLDYRAAQRVVEPLEPGRLLRDGTAIGTGIATGLNVLRESHAKSKLLILLTDGENNSGEIAPLDAAQMAKLLGIRLYTIGVAENEVDERLMRQLSELTGAHYYSASDEGTLLEIYREIELLEKSRVGARRGASYEDAYLLFVIPGAALLALEVLLATTLFRRAP